MSLELGARPDPATSAYRHDAFFYAGLDEFVAGTAQFLRDGLTEGAAMLVVVSPEKIKRLRAALGETASSITFLDMAAVGKNPARIIAVWREWVDEHVTMGRPMRGIGEPVYPERCADELTECARHESLLNVAFDGTEPFWLLCPYDVSALEQAVVDEARRTHPSLIEGQSCRHSTEYVPVDSASPFAAPLPPMPGPAEEVAFADGDMAAVRELTMRAASTAGFSKDRQWDLVLAVNELATNSVRHGGGHGRLRVAVVDGQVVCEVVDSGFIRDPLIGRLPPALDSGGGRGLWIANQLCDLVRLHSGPSGTTVRLFMRA